jgi:hypothetical protein
MIKVKFTAEGLLNSRPRTRIIGTLHEDQFTFSMISSSVLVRKETIEDKICREKQNTHFIFSDGFYI